MKDTMTEILEHWTLLRLYEAHVVLDALDAAEAAAHRKAAPHGAP